MAFGAATIWDVRTTGDTPAGADTNGGGFSTLATNMATDLAVLQSTGASTLVSASSATYSAQARDITHWIYAGAGTGWNTGWYQIASLCGSTATVSAGGTGYSVNDILTLSGGTSTATAKFKVATLSGSAVATVTLDTLGAYSVLPANPVSTTSSPGSGCTLTVLWGFNLTATIGSGYLSASGVPYAVTTAAGIGSASPGGNATWSVDYSQSTSLAFTDLVIDGTTNTDATSSTKPLNKNFIGNVFNVTSGTGFTVQRVQLLSIPSGVIGRFDKSLGTLSSTGGNAACGGPLATPGTAGLLKIALNSVFIKNGTYTCSSSSNVAGGRVTEGTTGTLTTPNYWTGWNTARHIHSTNTTRPLLQAAANSVTSFTVTGAFSLIRNITFGRSAAETSTTGLTLNGTHQFVDSCTATDVASGFTTGASGTNCTFRNCLADTCGQGYVSGSNAGMRGFGCVSKAHTTAGFNVGDFDSTFVNCIAYAGTGTSDGFALSGQGGVYINCTSQGNAGDGFSVTTGGGLHLFFNCVATGNGGFQYNQTTSTETSRRLYNCAAKADGSGTDNLNAQQKIGFITLTADPFIATGSGNFGLNSTLGGGASLLAAGFPGVFPGISSTGYLDIGAVQSGIGGPGAAASIINNIITNYIGCDD